MGIMTHIEVQLYLWIRHTHSFSIRTTRRRATLLLQVIMLSGDINRWDASANKIGLNTMGLPILRRHRA